MARGPGKYDEIATMARIEAQAEGVVVIVLGGKHGNGFSVQTLDAELVGRLPDLLEELAREIRMDTAQ